MSNAIAYPSTGQYKDAIRRARSVLSHGGYDSDGEVIRVQQPWPVVPYIGTYKIHGTNGSAVKFEDGTIQFQAKTRVLTLESDNFDFRAFMVKTGVIEDLFERAEQRYRDLYNREPEYPIEIAGEYAGRGIQRTVSVGEVDRFFAIFGVGFGYNERGGIAWQPTHSFKDISSQEHRIYNIMDFGFEGLDIDFNQPEKAQAELIKRTELVEKHCPVGWFFGVAGIGEGIVWKPFDYYFVSDTDLWFKVKGEKHSSSKVKTLAPVDTELMASIDAFIDYAVTDNRLAQGVSEVGLDVKTTGQFIGWVSRDIVKEESDTLEKTGLNMKMISRALGLKARTYYMKAIEDQAVKGD